MANLQYIGARYVPKFYLNPDDNTTNWKSGVSYEPLTVVTYLDDSYTSKIAVPASVGDPASNPTYWALTGNYNAGMTNLQNQITQNANDIIANAGNITKLFNGAYLHGKNVVAYGDSTIRYGTGYLKMAADAAGFNLTNRAVSGSRMTQGTDNGVSLINASNDLNDFDFIILAYGTNDWINGRTRREIQQDVDALLNAVWAKNLEINIIFIVPYWSWRQFTNGYTDNHNDYGMSLRTFNDLIIDRLNYREIAYIDLYARSTCNSKNYTKLLVNDGSSYLHPKTAFQRELSEIILNGAEKQEFKYLIPMLNTLDFQSARSAISDSDFSNYAGAHHSSGNFEGLLIKFSSEVESVTKLFGGGYLRLVGVTTAPITFTIGATVINCDAGDFDYVFGVGNASTKIKINTNTADTVINDLQLYKISDTPDYCIDWHYGASVELSGNEAGITYVETPKLEINNDEIIIGAFRIDLTSGLTGNPTVFDLPSGISVDRRYLIAMKSATGEMIHMIMNPTKCQIISGTIPSGRFCIDQIRMKNRKYPNTTF